MQRGEGEGVNLECVPRMAECLRLLATYSADVRLTLLLNPAFLVALLGGECVSVVIDLSVFVCGIIYICLLIVFFVIQVYTFSDPDKSSGDTDGYHKC